MSERLYEEKVMIKGGAKHYFIKMNDQPHYKYHRWDGPAIEPIKGQSSEYKKEYYLSGIQYNEEDYRSIMKEREGLPWYKQAGGGTARF